MSAPKILVVFGATGNQGGSVVNSILEDPKAAAEFKIRAITRNTSKPAAVALTKRGVECVVADMDDEASLKAAIDGAYAVWAVTDYWASGSADVEIRQGKSVADISKAAGVQHMVFSSLLDVNKLSGGELPKVFHFDSKATIETYMREIGLPSTFLLPGFYMSNITGSVRKGEDDIYTYALPIPADSPMPLFAGEYDTGKFVKAILLNREQTLGKQILAATNYYTPTELVAEFAELYGVKAKYAELPPAVFKSFITGAGKPEIIAEELLQNMQLMPKFGYYGGKSLDESKAIVDEPLTTWKEFASKAPAWASLK